MNLLKLKLGDTAFINNISGDEKLTKRLLALGCIKGTEVRLKSVAPFGDPLLLSIRGFDIAIRKKDAQNILISNKEKF